MIEGRYAAEKDAEVMGEGGCGRRRSDGSEVDILQMLVVVTVGSNMLDEEIQPILRLQWVCG